MRADVLSLFRFVCLQLIVNTSAVRTEPHANTAVIRERTLNNEFVRKKRIVAGGE
jgi:hypothetical protein